MKTIQSSCLALFCAIALSVSSLFAQSADEIMKKVDNHIVPKDTKSIMKMNLIDSKNQVRQRELKTYKWGDSKMMMWFLNPADVKGSSFLKLSYDDKDDDMWIYLPALGKVRRIASSTKNGSFMGSDFTFEDMGDRKFSDYTYKLLKSEQYAGKQCWVIEITPKSSISTDYSKIISWVWKDDFSQLKEEFYNKKGTLKKVKTVELIKLKNYWVPKRIVMNDMSVNHKTEMVFDKIEVDTGIDLKIFDQSNMTKVY